MESTGAMAFGTPPVAKSYFPGMSMENFSPVGATVCYKEGHLVGEKLFVFLVGPESLIGGFGQMYDPMC